MVDNSQEALDRRLIRAVEDRKGTAVRFLLRKGANPSQTTADGIPLLLAIARRCHRLHVTVPVNTEYNSEIADYLIVAGADDAPLRAAADAMINCWEWPKAYYFAREHNGKLKDGQLRALNSLTR